MHNRRVTDETIDLIERARRRLKERDLPCAIAGAIPDAAIDAAEESLGVALPGSYRAFLRTFGALSLPHRLSTIHQFVGLDPRGAPVDGNGSGKTVVDRTLHARVENRMPKNLVIVGLGAETGEWYCVDVDRARGDGEAPIVLFDARDNQLDQVFYDDFASMLHEVLTFVLETLDEAGDGADPAVTDVDDSTGETSLGGVY